VVEGAGPAPAEKPSQLRVRTLNFGTSEAYRALQNNFEGFLEREPLQFSLQSLGRWIERARDRIEQLPVSSDRLEAMEPTEVLGGALPVLIGALFVFAFFMLTRQVGGLTHRLQARIHLPVSRWTTRLVRGLVLIAGRLVPILVLLVASYFPVQAVFESALWTRLLTQTLWVSLTYRFVSSLISVLISGRLIDFVDDQGERLEQAGLTAVRIAFGFVLVLELLRTAGAASELYHAIRFLFRCAFVAVPIYCYALRDTVLQLLPESLESRFYDVYRTFLQRNFETLMLGTAGLLVFRAAGFFRASNFLLFRGYAILGIALALFLLDSSVRRLLRRRVDFLAPDEQRDTVLEQTDRIRLSRRVQQLITLAIAVGIGVATLDLLLLLEPTLIVLRTPFLAIGQAKISFLSIVNLGFIVFGTVLFVKFLRALLNSKIYPLLEVDVGVAYAINTILKYIVALVAFFLGISALGIDLTAVTVVLASLGVGIGFGLQTLVENLISGFIILFGRSVQKGDYITVEGTYGQVDAVGARSVVIKTPDNYEMLIPSKEIVGGRIINWSYEDNSVRARLPVGVSYEEDPHEVKHILLEVCDRHEHVLEDPEPRVRLTDFGDSSVNFELLFFFDCRQTTEKKVIGELNFNVWDALQEEDVEIPFPQRDLHIKPDEEPPRPELIQGGRFERGGGSGE
jgi:small-conductance mechanosensitive channel